MHLHNKFKAVIVLAFFFQWPTSWGQEPDLLGISNIQIGLLIDVSGSMDGLVMQAQSQIWKLVNYLSQFQKDNHTPEVALAVLSYGSDRYPTTGYVNIEIPFTTDLSELAEQLFSMNTGGSEEYCGLALQTALDSLLWHDSNAGGYQAIFIAGNETFEQGPIDFRTACAQARQRGVLINSIYCGKYDEGIYHLWEAAATAGNGAYNHIEQNIDLEQLKTPYDGKIAELYRNFANTQIAEDKLSHGIPQFQFRESGEINPIYRDMIIHRIRNDKYTRRDIIDELEDQKLDLMDIGRANLPPAFADMPLQEIRRILTRKLRERQLARQAIDLYGKKVEEFLEVKMGPRAKDNTLDSAIREIVTTQLEARGFVKMR